jgi:type II secretory ATPase GspE/PulE/Tfp pilus assembly ATPase PilB-like protein
MKPIINLKFAPGELAAMGVDEAVRAVLLRASRMGCSDAFLLTDNNAVTVAARRHGRLEHLSTVPSDFGRHMISLIKAEANMNIAEQRRPQDGRWIIRVEDRELDMRINCITTLHGTDMSLRMWDRTAGVWKLEDLGMPKAELSRVSGMLNQPSGLILVTGPTGTGKTTTLYACLQFLNSGSRKINTLEDPVEIDLPGVRQSPVAEKYDHGYANLLRNVLRQAPDVIMVGEIRDKQTADTAILAANTGQLVLTTLHAPTTSAAPQSMIALQVNPYHLSTSLIGLLTQRLVRTLCPHCRIRYDLSDSPETFKEIAHLLHSDEGTAIYGPAGCEQCFNTGYGGRTGLFEVMTMNQEIRQLIANSRPRVEIEAAAVRAGMVPLRHAALLKVAQGATTTEDVLRDVSADLMGLED